MFMETEERQTGYTTAGGFYPSFLNITRFKHGPLGNDLFPVVRVTIRDEPKKARGVDGVAYVEGPATFFDIPESEFLRMVKEITR
jgi:hypothetical protein